jgi:hypothetical protein
VDGSQRELGSFREAEMQINFSRLSGALSFVCATSVVLSSVACSDEASSDPRPDPRASGGNGGSQIFDNIAGANDGPAGAGTGGISDGQAGAGGAPSKCESVPAADPAPLIDDFEDGNGTIAGIPRRVGYWHVTDDLTSGTRTPSGNFLPEKGGVPGSDYAVHVTAAGFTKWGVSLGVSLEFKEAARVCPLNASPFKGIAFQAKGPGRVYLQVQVPGILPTDLGGTCDPQSEECFNSHKALVKLTADWARYEVSWPELLQDASWGKHVDFDPKAIKGLAFTVLPDDLPTDFWLDDVSFIADSGASKP